MARENLGSIHVHFTDEHYATKQEVQKQLKISNVDTFWNRILEYRSSFTRDLDLTMLTRDQLKICLTPKIGDRIIQMSLGLAKATQQFNKLNKAERVVEMVEDAQVADILRQIASRYNINVEDSFIQNVIRDNVSTLYSENFVLVHYNNVIKMIAESTSSPLDEDFLGEIYKTINGGAQLTEFYREEEIRDYRQSAQVSSVYIYAPTSRIDDMMSSLFNYIETSEEALFVKLSAIYFYFNYIKPFTYFSEELSIAFVKAFLVKEGYGDIAPYLGLEKLLSSDDEKLEQAMYNVKKSSDLTYLLVYLLEVFAEVLNEFLDTIIKAEKQLLVDEYYSLKVDEIEQQSQVSQAAELPPHFSEQIPSEQIEEDPIKEQSSLEQSVEVKPAPRHEVPLSAQPIQSEVPLEQPEVKEEVVEKPKQEEVPVFEEQPQASALSFTPGKPQIAITNIPVELSEEDAERLTAHLLELNPTLKHGEAYFYARHCTIGKYYTIRQYKETMGVAYETARTSMDNLAEQGYYRKEQLKNKFIYTPIVRR